MDMYVTYLRRGGGGGLCELAKPIMHIFVSEVDAFKMPLCAQVHVKGGERSEKKKREREKEEKREVRRERSETSYLKHTCTTAPSNYHHRRLYLPTTYLYRRPLHFQLYGGGARGGRITFDRLNQMRLTHTLVLRCTVPGKTGAALCY